jgi:hypothetical protein
MYHGILSRRPVDGLSAIWEGYVSAACEAFKIYGANIESCILTLTDPARGTAQ